MYMLFMGPPELDCEWQDAGIEGIKRFVNKLINYLSDKQTLLTESQKEDIEVTKRLHKLIKEIQDRLALFKPNTAIAAFMEWVNDAIKQKMQLSKESMQSVLSLLSVFAPHVSSELLETLLGTSLEQSSWPTYDPKMVQVTEVTYAIQVNGKLRGTVIVSKDATQNDVEPLAKEQIAKWLEGKQVVKVIFIPGRMISFVIR